VREKAWAKVPDGCQPRSADGEIVKDELAELMGGQESELNAKGNLPSFQAGFTGSGKTL